MKAYICSPEKLDTVGICAVGLWYLTSKLLGQLVHFFQCQSSIGIIPDIIMYPQTSQEILNTGLLYWRVLFFFYSFLKGR